MVTDQLEVSSSYYCARSVFNFMAVSSIPILTPLAIALQRKQALNNKPSWQNPTGAIVLLPYMPPLHSEIEIPPIGAVVLASRGKLILYTHAKTPSTRNEHQSAQGLVLA